MRYFVIVSKKLTVAVYYFDKNKFDIYSVLRLFTGLINATFNVW